MDIKNRKNSQMKLLVMDTSENPSEILIHLLLKSNIPVSAHRVAEKSELFELLKSKNWDILLLNDDIDDVTSTECIACIHQYKSNTALVSLISRKIEVHEMTESFSNGVSALASLSFPEYSIMAILKEFNAVQDKEMNNLLIKANQELEERCHVLLSSSQDALAYIHQGMHVFANESYIKRFKFEDLDNVLCTPFLDMVNDGDKEKLKKLLNLFESGEISDCIKDEPFNLIARDLEGVEFNAQLHFKVTYYDGESSLQVLINTEEVDKTKEVLTPSSSVLQEPSETKLNSNLTSISVKKAENPTPVEKLPQLTKSKSNNVNLIEIRNLFKKSTKTIAYKSITAVPDLEAEIYEIDIRFYDKKPNNLKINDIKKIVEDDSIGRKIDRWVLTQTIPTISEIYDKGQTLQVLYTPVISSLRDDSFPLWLIQLVVSSGLSSDALIININQEDILREKESVIQLIKTLRKHGIKICISEYTMNSALKEIVETNGIGFIKLNNKVSHKNIHDEDIMKSLEDKISALHKHNIRVMVDEIDDAKALSLFWGIGVDLMQGEYFQKDDLEFNVESFVEKIAI